MIRIYDGNNWYRAQIESDPTGLAPRKLLTSTLATKDVVIYVWDAPDGSRKRRALFDGYKRNRKPAQKDLYVGFDVGREVLKHTQAIQICVPGYEADDIIATLAQDLASKGEQVAIYSNDYDYAILSGRYPQNIFVGAKPKAAVPPDLVAYYKCTVGDPSDNIPGIAGFGAKTWDETPKADLKLLIDSIVQHDKLTDLALPKRCRTWLETNWPLVKTYWSVVNFFDVPSDVISAHTTVGVSNYAAADAYLKSFYL